MDILLDELDAGFPDFAQIVRATAAVGVAVGLGYVETRLKPVCEDRQDR